ncbi:hypothetical protein, partial [Helicobacter typhlonius]
PPPRFCLKAKGFLRFIYFFREKVTLFDNFYISILCLHLRHSRTCFLRYSRSTLIPPHCGHFSLIGSNFEIKVHFG